jgi:hypothetical protein
LISMIFTKEKRYLWVISQPCLMTGDGSSGYLIGKWYESVKYWNTLPLSYQTR